MTGEKPERRLVIAWLQMFTLEAHDRGPHSIEVNRFENLEVLSFGIDLDQVDVPPTDSLE